MSGAPEFERWLDEQRAALRRAVADAGWRRVDEMEKSGEPGIGEAARRAWAIDPTNEAGTRRLMQLLDATNGRAAALSAYDDLVDYLRREHDTVPAAETRALAERLRARIHAPPPPLCPSLPVRQLRDSSPADSRDRSVRGAGAAAPPVPAESHGCNGDPGCRGRVGRRAPIPAVGCFGIALRWEGQAGAARRAPTSRPIPRGHRGLRLIPPRSVPAVPGAPQRGARHVRGVGRAGPRNTRPDWRVSRIPTASPSSPA